MPKVILVPMAISASRLVEMREEFFPVESFENPDVTLRSHAPRLSVDHACDQYNRRNGYDPRSPADADDPYHAASIFRHIEGPHRWGVMIHDFSFKDTKIDPMISEVMWRLDIASSSEADQFINRESHTLSRDRSEQRFWNRRQEIEEWASNANDDVLVQPIENGSYRILCLNSADRITMISWLAKEKEHLVQFTLGGNRYTNIKLWILQNVRGEWFEVKDNNKEKMTLMIRDQKDAVMTKLRWSDPLDGFEGD